MVLETLPSKQRTTSAQAAARSSMVRRLRVALPVLAMVLIVAFFVTSRSDDEVNEVFLEDFKNLDATPQELEMANPQFEGVDGEGKPFGITAQRAIRNAQNNKRVNLNNPRAVTDGRGEQTIVMASAGVYEEDQKILELEENVTLEHAVGAETYVFETAAATVLLDQDQVKTDLEVTGVNANGDTLRADRMRAFQGEGRVVFEGNVKMKIVPKKEGVISVAPLREVALTDDGEGRE